MKFLDRPWKMIGTPAILMDDLDEERVGSFHDPESVLLNATEEL